MSELAKEWGGYRRGKPAACKEPVFPSSLLPTLNQSCILMQAQPAKETLDLQRFIKKGAENFRSSIVKKPEQLGQNASHPCSSRGRSDDRQRSSDPRHYHYSPQTTTSSNRYQGLSLYRRQLLFYI